MEEEEKSELNLSQSQKSVQSSKKNSVQSSKKNSVQSSKKNTKENFNKTQSKKNSENNSIQKEEINLNPDDFGPLIIDKDLINKLNGSGIVEGYEYVLRKLIEENLPREKVYEKCAKFLLDYQQNILKSNIRSKQIKDFVKVAMKDAFEDEEKKEIKSPKELIPNYNIQIQSKLLLEKEEKIKQEDNKIFETNIDELLKNKIKLASKENLLKDIENRPEYGSFAAFALNENEKIRNFNFKTTANYKKFEFIPILEVRKMMGYENNNPNNITLQNSQMFNTMGNSQINNNSFNNSQQLNQKFSENDINNAKSNSQNFVNNLIDQVSENIKESESESASQASQNQSQSQSQSQSKSVSKKLSKKPSKNSSKKSSISSVVNKEQSELNSNA